MTIRNRAIAVKSNLLQVLHEQIAQIKWQMIGEYLLPNRNIASTTSRLSRQKFTATASMTWPRVVALKTRKGAEKERVTRR